MQLYHIDYAYLIYLESEVLTSKKIVMVNEKGLTISFAQVYIFLN